jgi:hypothetical protein
MHLPQYIVISGQFFMGVGDEFIKQCSVSVKSGGIKNQG